MAGLVVCGVGASATVTGQPAYWHATVRERLSECKPRLCGLGIIDEYCVDVAHLSLLGPREESPPQSPDRREK